MLRAPTSLEAWVRYFGQAEIPVLESTVQSLAQLREDEDNVDAHTLADIVLSDPLMTLRLLVYMARNRPARLVTDAESVTSALLLTDVPPLLRHFADMTTVEQQLCEIPTALHGLHRVLRRAHRAARFAAGIAVLRKDGDAEMIHQAALLHEFAEALLWCQAPRLAIELFVRQRRDPTLRSAAVQREVLNIELVDLQQALMRMWKLPELLQWVSDDRHAERSQVRNVALATALARHSQDSWDNPALPDDFVALAELLNVSAELAHRKVLELNLD